MMKFLSLIAINGLIFMFFLIYNSDARESYEEIKTNRVVRIKWKYWYKYSYKWESYSKNASLVKEYMEKYLYLESLPKDDPRRQSSSVEVDNNVTIYVKKDEPSVSYCSNEKYQIIFLRWTRGMTHLIMTIAVFILLETVFIDSNFRKYQRIKALEMNPKINPKA